MEEIKRECRFSEETSRLQTSGKTCADGKIPLKLA
jgi:hypothetical protein